jgi:hypothetical protein
VLIRALLARGDSVTVLMAPSPGLALLRAELRDNCAFYEYEDIPKPFSRYPAVFYTRMSLAVPRIWRRFVLEQRLTEKLARTKRIDAVVSDSRLGVWSKTVPSYWMPHAATRQRSAITHSTFGWACIPAASCSAAAWIASATFVATP